MTISSIAAKFDNRAGYRLVDYGQVGLPVYKVTIIALTLVKKALDPIDEFVLRAISLGLHDSLEVSGLLGLSANIVNGTVANLIRDEQVRVCADNAPLGLTLTDKGRITVQEQEEIKPIERTLAFTFDGLTRRPKWYGESILYSPKELAQAGIPEIRPYPARGPELHELDVRDVADTFDLETPRGESSTRLLSIRSVERRVRLFKDAVALAYRSEDPQGLQIAFAIDGRLSEHHETAFSSHKGLERNKIFRSLLRPPKLSSIEEVLGPELLKLATSPATTRDRSLSIETRDKAVQARRSIALSDSPEAKEDAMQELTEAQETLEAITQSKSAQEVRPLEVYEHPPILFDALSTATDRLLIISPWIRSSVVDSDFLKNLEALVLRGVTTLIGYGLGDDDRGERHWDQRARKSLERLASRHENFTLRQLGDTHAKVLIKDRDFFVISSFNWLSFKGDPNRTFREEWGTLVTISDVVDEYFDRMSVRFKDETAEDA